VNKEVTVPDLGEPVAYGPENLGKFVKYVPITDDDQLLMTWILPNMELEIETSPMAYFTELFGHEGENSLLSYLSSEGLATGVSAGEEHRLHAFTAFSVSISLTN
jgi:insulysin